MTLCLSISNIVVNSILLGIIMMTQFVSYPLMKNYNENFHTIHQNYMKRMGYVAGSMMVLEFLIISFLFLLNFENKVITAMFLITCLIWLSTFVIQVPLHQELTKKKENKLIQRLINTNWIRTILWSVKLVLSLISF